jgi:hypothetical protein
MILRPILVSLSSLVFVFCASGCGPQSPEQATSGSESRVAADSAAAPLSLIWETGGFAAPDSAIYDSLRDTIYVSCINGQPHEMNGLGYIARVSGDGKILDLQWIGGLNAPKGIARSINSLFIADIDRIVEVDIDSRAIRNEWPVPEAQFLNDLAIGPDNAIYVADTVGNAVWRLKDGKVEALIRGEELLNPNGLEVEGDHLLIAGWGHITDPATWATDVPGRVLKVDLAAQPPAIIAFGDGAPIGNLDGIGINGIGGYYVSDWAQSALFQVDIFSGAATLVQKLPAGSADIGVIREKRTLLVPVMSEGKLIAYRY